ncbi:MAG TPA: tRNA (N6-threonylcarbamoyladenosine(37)-N6)-methyltransferase TrmO [Anaerolineaceae bacterium]|nr:tRNA (N6-threonylcarbamoyladenosine(37)-N6)-methyltransferase TrmO [Anaerolineaceae bacterium]HPC06173.1 tRNA (N6-threonylcarbamoyladenosine(37)-N6)-methyltransferase TrmO [Anaerolineaceae bacterium]HQN04928.1 tRNA (N6-threonylcarbamoyladenosine(37)-N6)-methyltransferase TrmO [Anaerolineaceae bacterium]HQP08397.1 tRNA (N6-threonylcarbamoyladenosine(37)-N6)-methyltransferase TrmO [Anaerolineaceae bacterium]
MSLQMEYLLKVIGVIRTPFTNPDKTPIQSSRSEYRGTVDIFPEYLDGIIGIEEFSRTYLLYMFHQADQPVRLKVKPFLDEKEQGLFTTRYSVRPNPIGFSIVKVLSREGCTIKFSGADMFDGTPLLDIKPYIPDFDWFDADRTGWYEKRKHE